MDFFHPGYPCTKRSLVWLVLDSNTIRDQFVITPHGLVNFTGPLSETVLLGDKDLETRDTQTRFSNTFNYM